MPVLTKKQAPCPLPTITTEDVDIDAPASPRTPTPPEDEFAVPPARVRMRSLSGGAYRLAPTLPAQGRTRRQSGDDVLSPSRRAALLEHFRPRSKSDSKGKRPTFLTSLKNSLFSNSAEAPKSSRGREPSLDRCDPHPDYRQRSRSGSESRGGTMSKMMDFFRNRSNSVSVESGRGLTPRENMLQLMGEFGRRHSVDPDRRRWPVLNSRMLDGHPGEASFAPCAADDEAGDSRIDYGALEDEQVIPTFLSSHTCYHAMPKSGKVILLCTDLLIKNAFSSLLVNEIKSAPLWDSTTSSFVGILTITDFINVLRHYYYSSKEDIHAIENQQIQTWRRITNVTKPFVKVGPSDSLANAAKVLIHEGVHRLPVFDEKRTSVLSILTRKRLLQYLYQNLIDKFETTNVKTPNFFKKSIQELRIGTYVNIAVATPETRVIEALDLFVERNISSLPVVENNKLTNIFAKFDVFALAKEQTYHNLDMTISEALDKAGVHEETCTCLLDEPLASVIYKFVTCKVHRVVVVDDKESVIGIISLSDILKFLILEPLALLGDSAIASSDIIEEEGASCGVQPETSVTGSELESSTEVQNCLSESKRESPDLSDDLIKLQVASESNVLQTSLDISPVERIDPSEEPEP